MATTIELKNIPTGFQTFISNGRHGIVGDEPERSEGTDLGFAPSELVLAGLAMCKVATVRYIARKKGWEIRDVDGRLTQTVKRHGGGRLTTHVSTEIEIEGDLTPEQKEELLYEADNCYIHRMIEGDWKIEPARRDNPVNEVKEYDLIQ